MSRQSEINATYELVQREKATLLNAGEFDLKRWKDFIVFAGKAGCKEDADEMKRLLKARVSTSEYAIIKRSLFAAVEVSEDLSLMDANTVIADSVRDALEELPDEQQAIIKREQQHLMDKFKGLGATGALELLASLAEFV